MTMDETQTHFDVLIVGAGLSGVGAAYHLQTECPTKTFAILEARETMGGTWDLFRYPGIRSDSDMFTLGYSFRPWASPKGIADGPSILAYIRETAQEYGIDKKVLYQRRVTGARWSSETSRWTLDVHDAKTGVTTPYTCNFLFVCAGYYDYESGYTPEFAGRERFRGRIVHPQFWTDDIDYAGKRVIVIGSGATAMTLVPEMAKRAAHVTMVQRSPTYVISLPARDPLAHWMWGRVPPRAAYELVRWKNVLMGMAFYEFSRRFPDRAKRVLVAQVKRALGPKHDIATDFTPRYNPWDQRLCLVPDGDLFDALREGRASVVTDSIETFSERGLRLASGREIEADLIVTATGLSLKFLGGMSLDIDGKRVEPSKTMTYKGMMLADVPNLAVAIGYTNASWTLKCDLTCEYVCRLLNHMTAHGYKRCMPHNTDPSLTEEPLLNLTAGYVQRAMAMFPRQGSRAPWKVYQNYALDRRALRGSQVDDGVMQFA